MGHPATLHARQSGLEYAAWVAGQALGVWALPDAEHLVNLLRDIAQNREVYKAQAMQKAPNVHKLYSWERFGEGVLQVFSNAKH